MKTSLLDMNTHAGVTTVHNIVLTFLKLQMCLCSKCSDDDDTLQYITRGMNYDKDQKWN